MDGEQAACPAIARKASSNRGALIKALRMAPLPTLWHRLQKQPEKADESTLTTSSLEEQGSMG